MRALFLACRWLPSCSVIAWLGERKKKNLSSLFLKGHSPIRLGPHPCDPFNLNYFLKPYVHTQSLSHVWHCDSMDCSPPSSSVHGIFQARKLEWVAISSSRVSSQLRDQTQVFCVSCTGRWVLYPCATREGPHQSPYLSPDRVMLGFVSIYILVGHSSVHRTENTWDACYKYASWAMKSYTHLIMIGSHHFKNSGAVRPSLGYPFIHVTIVIEFLLCARYHSRHWAGSNREKI